MPFNKHRFSTFNAGQTGAGLLAKYDGSGTPAEGGDPIGTIDNDGYINSQEAKDAVAQASDGRTTGAGLVILLVGNDGMKFDVLFNDAGTLKLASVSGGAPYGGAGNRGNFEIT